MLFLTSLTQSGWVIVLSLVLWLFQATVRVLVYRVLAKEIYESIADVGPDFCFIGMSLFFTAIRDQASHFHELHAGEIALASIIYFASFVILYIVSMALAKKEKEYDPIGKPPKEWLRIILLILVSQLIGGCAFYVGVQSL